MTRSGQDLAELLHIDKSGASRLLSGKIEWNKYKVDRFVERTGLRESVPGFQAQWLDEKPSVFAERMSLLGYGEWRHAAQTAGWIDTIPALAGQFMPEAEVRLCINPPTYRSVFGNAPEVGDLIVPAVTIQGRYGLAVEQPEGRVLEALLERRARIVLLHRVLRAPSFERVPVDMQRAVHVLFWPKEDEDAGEDQPEEQAEERRTLLLANVVKQAASTRYGFDVGGEPGQRELALFVFGTAADLAESWDDQGRTMTPDTFAQLGAAAAKATNRGDLLRGRLRFHALP
jgi:hypothetical protein